MFQEAQAEAGRFSVGRDLCAVRCAANDQDQPASTVWEMHAFAHLWGGKESMGIFGDYQPHPTKTDILTNDLNFTEHQIRLFGIKKKKKKTLP